MNRFRRLMISLIACLAASLPLAPTGTEAARKVLTVGTAPAGTGSFPFMVAVATLVNKNVPELALSPQESGGAVGNLRELAAGKLQVATTSAVVNAKAIRGQAPFKKKIPVQLLFTMFGQKFIYFGLNSAGVKSWDDVKGKRMVLGAPGGSTRVVGQLIAKAKGLTKDNFSPLFLRWGAMVNALKDKRVDGGYGLIQGGAPNSPTTEVATTLQVSFFGPDAAAISKLLEDEPGLSKVSVAANSIPNQPNSFSTVAEYLQVGVLANSVTEREAYQITKAVLENYKRLGRFSPAARTWTLKTAVEGTEGKTFHPGALRYLKEKGLK